MSYAKGGSARHVMTALCITLRCTLLEGDMFGWKCLMTSYRAPHGGGAFYPIASHDDNAICWWSRYSGSQSHCFMLKRLLWFRLVGYIPFVAAKCLYGSDHMILG